MEDGELVETSGRYVADGRRRTGRRGEETKDTRLHKTVHYVLLE